MVFKQVKTFLAPPNLTAPQTPGLDPPLPQWDRKWALTSCQLFNISRPKHQYYSIVTIRR